MSNCYSCGTKLIKKYQATEAQINDGLFASKEHIIPNFFGGKSYSYNLLCNRCNNKFGSTIDSELCSQLWFPNLVDFKKDRKGSRPVVGNLKGTNIELLVDSKKKSRLRKPQIVRDEQGKAVSVYARNRQEAIGFLREELKNEKSPKEINKIISSMNYESLFNKKMDAFFDSKTIDHNSYYGIAKIAINFYLSSGFSINHILGIIDYIKTNSKDHQFVRMFYPALQFKQPKPGELYNCLYLVGDSKKELLYCYVELFNTAKYIIMLNNEYIGADISKKYQWNLIKAKEEECKLNFKLFWNPIIRDDDNKHVEREFNKGFTRLIKIINQGFK